MHPLAFEEPTLISAPLAHAAAARLCRKDVEHGADCSWYHGAWQYFRALGLVSDPTVHRAVLLSSLRELARTGQHPRVLISGATDYSLLAHVLRAYQLEDAQLTASAVDICATPLYLSKWYADRLGADITTSVVDILDYQAPQPFDVICTHAFLGYFDATGRRRLIAQWKNLLRPGGRVVTIQRIRPDYTDEIVRFSAEHARSFRMRVLEEATKQQEHLDIIPEVIAAMAQVYAERFWGYPVKSQNELADLFTAGGFCLEQFSTLTLDTHRSAQNAGPTIPSHAEFVHVVASRI